MSNEFKRTFYSSLMAVLVVVSNLIGIKYTNFMQLTLSVSFITFPFIFLCILLLTNICNKRESARSLLSAVLIQVFILLSYVLVVNLGSQATIPDFANAVNTVFNIDLTYIMINLIAILIGNYIMQYIYEYFRIIGYKLLGTVISLLATFILYGLITIPVINYGFSLEIILNTIMCHIIMSVIMTAVITIIFYLLKNGEYPYHANEIFIKNVKTVIKKEEKDKPIEEVLDITSISKNKKQEKRVQKKKNNQKKVNKSKKVVKK